MLTSMRTAVAPSPARTSANTDNARSSMLLLEVGVGLVAAFGLQMMMLHWLAAAIYLLPWYWNLDLRVVFAGLRESTWAIGGFTLGVAIITAPRVRPSPTTRSSRTSFARAVPSPSRASPATGKKSALRGSTAFDALPGQRP